MNEWVCVRNTADNRKAGNKYMTIGAVRTDVSTGVVVAVPGVPGLIDVELVPLYWCMTREQSARASCR
jgi:hypothetical protein